MKLVRYGFLFTVNCKRSITAKKMRLAHVEPGYLITFLLLKVKRACLPLSSRCFRPRVYSTQIPESIHDPSSINWTIVYCLAQIPPNIDCQNDGAIQLYAHVSTFAFAIVHNSFDIFRSVLEMNFSRSFWVLLP